MHSKLSAISLLATTALIVACSTAVAPTAAPTNPPTPAPTPAPTLVGMLNCRQHTSSSSGSLYHVMEWTRDELLVLGYISNRADLRTWEDLIDFWSNKAGPFPPGQ